MIRALVCITAGLLISGGLGCSFLQQSDPVTAAAAQPEKTVINDQQPVKAASDEMTLHIKEWSWKRTTYNNDTTITPAQPGVFMVRFNRDNTVHVGTDCNRMSGSYSVDGKKLSFSRLAATRMYCPDSQETKFGEMLSQVTSFLFTPRGELVLELKFDSGQILLK